jgi:hypothetical protein
MSDFPTRDDAEFGYSVSKTVLGAIPFIGGAAQEVLEKAIGDPLRKRQESWMADLGLELAALVARVDGITAEGLANHPQFVSAAARATQDALLTHSATKRDALRNTVLNVAAGVKLDDVLVGAFMDYLERFSEPHIKLLALLRDPMGDRAYADAARNVYAGSIHGVVTLAHPDLAAQPDLLDRLYSDLSREGLIGGSLKAMMTGSGIQNSQTTSIGNAFLDFISPPNVLATASDDVSG